MEPTLGDRTLASLTLRYQLSRIAFFFLEKPNHVERTVQLNIGDVRISFSRLTDGLRPCVHAMARIQFEADQLNGYDDPAVATARLAAEEALGIAANLLCIQTAGRVRIESCPPFFTVSWPSGAVPMIQGSWEITGYLADPDIDLQTMSLFGDLQIFVDRFNGLALFSQATSADTGVGRFLDYWRLYENAFAMSCHDLADKRLVSFFNDAGFDYDRSETREWASFRDGAAHADQKKSLNIVLDSDVARYLPRMKQGALDVLFNKATWHSGNPKRRSIWKPSTWLNRSPNDFTCTKDMHTDIKLRMLDPFTGWGVATDRRCQSRGDCVAPTHNPRIPMKISVIS